MKIAMIAMAIGTALIAINQLVTNYVLMELQSQQRQLQQQLKQLQIQEFE